MHHTGISAWRARHELFGHTKLVWLLPLCPPKKRRTGRQNRSQELPTYLLIIPAPKVMPAEAKGDGPLAMKAGAAFFVVVVVVVVVVTADAGT